MNAPVVWGPQKGRDYWVWGDRYSFKTTGSETGAAHALLEMQVRPGSGTPPHIHHAEDEMFWVLSGTLHVRVGDAHYDATAGTFVAVPRGTVHLWTNQSDAFARVLVMLVPAGFEQFLMRIGTPVEDADGPPRVSQEEIDAAVAIAGDYRMEVVA